MAKNEPLVSVLITSYNREKYIADAIESVLLSTFKNFELIVVDDCSSDNTIEIIRSYEKKDNRIRVFVNEKNLGDYYNRNKAASYAIGKYIKYLDSDDILYAHGLSLFVESMEKYPDAAFGLCSIYDTKTPYPVLIEPRQIYLEHFFGFNHFFRAPGSAIIRRDIFESENGFSGKRWIGDTELWMKLASKYKLVKIHVDLYWARPHNQQEGSMFLNQTVSACNQIVEEYINKSSCPLSTKDLKAVKWKLRRKKIKNGLTNFIFAITRQRK